MTTKSVLCQLNLLLKKNLPNNIHKNRQMRRDDQVNHVNRFFSIFVAIVFVCSFFVLPKTWGLQNDADLLLQQAGGRDFKIPEPELSLSVSSLPTGSSLSTGSSADDGMSGSTASSQVAESFPGEDSLDIDSSPELDAGSATNELPISDDPYQLSPNTHFGLNEMITPAEMEALSEEPAQSGSSDIFGPYSQWGSSANDGKGWVILDAGHGGSDPGSTSDGLLEKDIVLEIVLDAAHMLEAQGVDLILTRESDCTVPVTERLRLANNIPAAFFISVHCDWYKDPVINGSSTLYSNYGSDTHDGLGARKQALAAIIQAGLTVDLGTANRGINQNDHIVVLREIKKPSAMVELAFLSNAKDRTLLIDPAFKQKAALNLMGGILNALARMPDIPAAS